jgi:uncharacterized protein (DUF433 family)
MDDLRHVPIYSIPEAAGHLGLPVPTVRSWVTGGQSKSPARTVPLVQPAGSEPTALSFVNLVELHVLAALRRKHGISMQQIRPAIDFLQDKLAVQHPLARRELLTDGLNIFTEHLGKLLNLSARGQIAIRVIIEAYLERVEHDVAGLAFRFYPYSRGDGRQAPKLIVIDPAISFGRPVIAGSGVRTAVVAKFVKAGETILDLAEDYRLQPAQIEEAVRYELAA